MKKVIVFVAASIFAAGFPVASQAGTGHDETCLKECRMQVKDCRQEVDSIQQRITGLNREIERGTEIYTAEELGKLKRKLQDVEQTLAGMTFGS